MGSVYPDQKVVPTRPKKKSAREIASTTASDPAFSSNSSVPKLSASRRHIGSKEILDAIAKKCGIEEDIDDLLDTGSAQKLISCARFLTCTDGECLSHIETWQLTHPIPYAEGLSKDICHRLTAELCTDETFRQGLFAKRILRQEGEILIVAFDASAVSTYSENQTDARYRFNKDKDGLKTMPWSLKTTPNKNYTNTICMFEVLLMNMMHRKRIFIF